MATREDEITREAEQVLAEMEDNNEVQDLVEVLGAAVDLHGAKMESLLTVMCGEVIRLHHKINNLAEVSGAEIRALRQQIKR